MRVFRVWCSVVCSVRTVISVGPVAYVPNYIVSHPTLMRTCWPWRLSFLLSACCSSLWTCDYVWIKFCVGGLYGKLSAKFNFCIDMFYVELKWNVIFLKNGMLYQKLLMCNKIGSLLWSVTFVWHIIYMVYIKWNIEKNVYDCAVCNV
jgi:hypothetical protein